MMNKKTTIEDAITLLGFDREPVEKTESSKKEIGNHRGRLAINSRLHPIRDKKSSSAQTKEVFTSIIIDRDGSMSCLT
jgi:hypothetical protein